MSESYKPWLILGVVLTIFTNTEALIKIYDSNRSLVEYFEFRQLRLFPLEEVVGYLWKSKPYNGCEPIEPPPSNATDEDWLVLMHFGNCSFNTKFRNAYNAGYNAVIFFNEIVNKTHHEENTFDTDQLGVKDADDAHFEASIFDHYIPAVKVRAEDGLRMSLLYLYDPNNVYLVDLDSINDGLVDYIYAVFGVFFFIFVLLVAGIIYKYFTMRAKRMSNRLTTRNLKHLTTLKFKKGDQYEVCAICLEEYDEGDCLRILPCQHAYHIPCVDPWLTKNKRVCPVCKRKISRKGAMSDSETEDSDSDGGHNEASPLLNHHQPPPESESIWSRARNMFTRNSNEDVLEQPSTSHESLEESLIVPARRSYASINYDYGSISGTRADDSTEVESRAPAQEDQHEQERRRPISLSLPI